MIKKNVSFNISVCIEEERTVCSYSSGYKLSQEIKEKWLRVVTNKFMSSEESDGEDIVIHPLPWHSARVDDVLSKVDAYLLKQKSAQAQRQMKS